MCSTRTTLRRSFVSFVTLVRSGSHRESLRESSGSEELSVLERAIPVTLDSLAVGGRIVVMAYQSLEDRIVKRALAEGSRVRAPHGLPVILASMQPWLQLLTRGAEIPTDDELTENPRSSSVRVRAAERLAVAA